MRSSIDYSPCSNHSVGRMGCRLLWSEISCGRQDSSFNLPFPSSFTTSLVLFLSLHFVARNFTRATDTVPLEYRALIRCTTSTGTYFVGHHFMPLHRESIQINDDDMKVVSYGIWTMIMVVDYFSLPDSGNYCTVLNGRSNSRSSCSRSFTAAGQIRESGRQ